MLVFTQGSAERATLGWMIESFQDSENARDDGDDRRHLATWQLGVLALNSPRLPAPDRLVIPKYSVLPGDNSEVGRIYSDVPARNSVVKPNYNVVKPGNNEAPGNYNVVKRGNNVVPAIYNVVKPENNVVPANYNVVPARNNVVKPFYNIVKNRSDMAGRRKEVVFTLKLTFLSKSGQIGTVEEMGIQRQGTKAQRCKVESGITNPLPIRRILKGFNHPAQGCAAGATLGQNQNIFTYPERVGWIQPLQG